MSWHPETGENIIVRAANRAAEAYGGAVFLGIGSIQFVASAIESTAKKGYQVAGIASDVAKSALMAIENEFKPEVPTDAKSFTDQPRGDTSSIHDLSVEPPETGSILKDEFMPDDKKSRVMGRPDDPHVPPAGD